MIIDPKTDLEVKFKNSIDAILKENREEYIVKWALRHCIDVGIVGDKISEDFKYQEKIKTLLIEQLKAIDLACIAKEENSDEIQVEVDHKVKLLILWVSKLYSQSLSPFRR